jgi:hypothetical protein
MTRVRTHNPVYHLGLRALGDSATGMTAKELAEHLKMSRRSVYMYIDLWKSENLITICDWKFDKSWSPMYAVKPTPWHKDIPKPAAKTQVQRQQEYRKRHAGVLKARKLMQAGKMDAYDRLIGDLIKGVVK